VRVGTLVSANRSGKRHVGSRRSETIAVPFERGTLRRAESHERRRHETGPTGVRKEQAVKRVTKPCRRNEARCGNLVFGGLPSLSVLKGAEVQERSRLLWRLARIRWAKL
jgi:hypothetical protein